MTTKVTLITGAILLGLWTVEAQQRTYTIDTDRDTRYQQRTDTFRMSSQNVKPENKGSEIIGMTVKNHQNETLGTVEEIVLDLKTKQISYLVIGTGGFLGVGEKLVAVSPDQLTTAPDENAFILNVTQQRLEQVQGLSENNWPAPNSRAVGTPGLGFQRGTEFQHQEHWRRTDQEPYWEEQDRYPGRTDRFQAQDRFRTEQDRFEMEDRSWPREYQFERQDRFQTDEDFFDTSDPYQREQDYFDTQDRFQPRGDRPGAQSRQIRQILREYKVSEQQIQRLERQGFDQQQVQRVLMQAMQQQGYSREQAQRQARQIARQVERRHGLGGAQQQRFGTERDQFDARHRYQRQQDRFDWEDRYQTQQDWRDLGDRNEIQYDQFNTRDRSQTQQDRFYPREDDPYRQEQYQPQTRFPQNQEWQSRNQGLRIEFGKSDQDRRGQTLSNDQEQRIKELLQRHGVSQEEIRELEQNNFTMQDVGEKLKESLQEQGRSEQQAKQQAKQIKEQIENIKNQQRRNN